MARSNPAKAQETGEKEPSGRRGHWEVEINRAMQRYRVFHERGKQIQNRYRLERENVDAEIYQDRYNILYSSTETMRPSLYAQTPKVQATKRQRDRDNPYVTYATMMLESMGQYALEEVAFDSIIKNCIQDYLLPGMGQAWVRYEPVIKRRKMDDDKPDDDEENYEEYLSAEGLALDYVFYKDFLTGVGRTWEELPWIARRVYFSKEKAERRFGAEKAAKLQYSHTASGDNNKTRPGDDKGGCQAIVYEIWDKHERKVIWYSPDFADDVLDQIDDPLKLRNFWPCPQPLRAVWSTDTFVPKGFYSQYRAQAEELDNLTERVRYLTQALRLVGVYDASQAGLAQLLQSKGNKMIPVDSWAVFAQNGGIRGSIEFLPIKEVAEVLASLLQQREVVKNEIYEITGFSDIVRGVSKASETLGAQQLKADWAGGRLRDAQKEVQRFCRDIIAIMCEIMAEQFSDETVAMYVGFEPPEITPQEQQAYAQYAAQLVQYNAQLTLPSPNGQPPQMPQKPPPTGQQTAIEQFKRTLTLLRNEKQRCALIGIETDSTIMPDETKEREDRMQFLAAAGAYLQQAGPMAMQYPDMRGLLGEILMFTIRTFRSSRPLEKTFQEFTEKLAQQPATLPPGQNGEGGGGTDPAAAQAQVQSEQIKAQSAQQTAKYKADMDAQIERERIQSNERIKMRELQLREREVRVKELEYGLDAQQAGVDAQLAERDANRADAQFSAGQANEQRRMDAEDAQRETAQNEA